MINMQKKDPSESAFFNLRTLLGCALVGIASLLAYVSIAAPAARDSRTSSANSATTVAQNWSDKVDERVSIAAAAGETEFMIYMTEQADLSGASALKTKNEKGLYVYQRLTTTAETTQAPVKQALTQLGVQHRGFWISNMIHASGNLAVIQTVASLPEVAAIYPVAKGAVKLPTQETTTSAATKNSMHSR